MESMHDVCSYHIEVRDTVNEDTFNSGSPLQITVKRVKRGATHFTVRTDQSGLIGLIRHLHRQGFVLLSVCRGGWITSLKEES
jgi:hypothetical protein